MRIEQAPYFIGIHYMANKTNLAILNFLTMPMVSELEGILLKILYGYFSSSPKDHLEFPIFAEIVEIIGLKVFRKVKTRWINMFQPLKCVGKDYKILIVKIVDDYSLMELAKANLLNLCDIDMILGLPWGKTQ
jgi:hypothetical protein